MPRSARGEAAMVSPNKLTGILATFEIPGDGPELRGCHETAGRNHGKHRIEQPEGRSFKHLHRGDIPNRLLHARFFELDSLAFFWTAHEQ